MQSTRFTLKTFINLKQIINEYDEYIRKLQKQSAQKADEYEQRIESVISKTNEQLKSIEGK